MRVWGVHGPVMWGWTWVGCEGVRVDMGGV